MLVDGGKVAVDGAVQVRPESGAVSPVPHGRRHQDVDFGRADMWHRRRYGFSHVAKLRHMAKLRQTVFPLAARSERRGIRSDRAVFQAMCARLIASRIASSAGAV